MISNELQLHQQTYIWYVEKLHHQLRNDTKVYILNFKIIYTNIIIINLPFPYFGASLE